MIEEKNPVDTTALGAVDHSDTPLTYRTSYEVPQVEGDFVDLCTCAKNGDQKAVAALWPVLYEMAVKALAQTPLDPEGVQELASEFADRNLIGWVNTEAPRGTGKPGPVPPLIQSCEYNYQSFFEGWLRLFVLKAHKQATIDPYAAGVVESYHAEDEDDDDMLSSHELGVGDVADDHNPTPYDVLEAKDALDKFGKWLPERLRYVYQGLRMGMRQEDMAEALGVSQAEISHRVKDIYNKMPQFKRECM